MKPEVPVATLVRRGVHRVRLLAAVALTFVALAAVVRAPVGEAATDTLPSRLSDDAFWHLVNDLSEPGGFFRSDNLLSNESTFQHVIPELQRRGLYHKDYSGNTLRENLGLPRPGIRAWKLDKRTAAE